MWRAETRLGHGTGKGDVEAKIWRNLRTPRTMYAALIYSLPLGILLFGKDSDRLSGPLELRLGR